MGRRVAKWLVVLGLGLAVTVLAADIALRFSRADDWLKGLLVSRARDSGRDISITGPIEIRLLPRPHIAAEGLSLRNSRGETLVSAQSASLAVSLRALMRGEIDFSPVTVQSPTISVTIDKDGKSNWDLPPSRDHRPPPEGDLIIRDGTVSFRDDRWQGASFTASGGTFQVRVGARHSSYALAGTATVKGIEARVDLSLDRTGRDPSYATKLSLSLPGAGIDVTGTLSELSPFGQIDGRVRAHVDSLLPYIERAKIDTEHLSPGLLGAFNVESAIRLSRQGLALPQAAFSIVPVRRTGERRERVEGTADLAADFSRARPRLHAAIRIPTLDFRDVMADKSNWAGLLHLLSGLSLAAIDHMPAEGDASLSLDIAQGKYNDRTVDDVHLGLGLSGPVAKGETSARLPGGTSLGVKGQLSGGEKQRRLAGSLSLRGDRPAETLHWLLPLALPVPDADAPAAPFDIEATLSPPAATTAHTVHASVDLNGIKGTADVGLDLAPQTAVDARASIAALDLLSFIKMGRVLGLDSLGLSGVEVRAKVMIDTTQPSLPMAFEQAEIAVRRLDARLAPLPARPIEKQAAPTAQDGPVHAIGQWLAALPEKVDTFVHPGPARSLIEQAFPSVSADLTEIEAWLYHLDFRTPLRVSVDQAVLREDTGVPFYRRRDAAAEYIAVAIMARDAPDTGKISTVALDLTVGAATASMARLSSGTVSLEGDLDRAQSGPRISALRLARLELDGDLDDIVNPVTLPGVTGTEAPPRRLPFVLKASGTADPGHAAITLDRVVLGDLADLQGVRLEASEQRAGLLTLAVSNAAATRSGRAAIRTVCTRRPGLVAGAHLLDFSIDLAGNDISLDSSYGLIDGASPSAVPRRPLVGALTARGFAARGATVVEDLLLRLGDSSTVAGKFAATSERQGARETVRAEGCLDTALQTQPRLASIGLWGQEMVMPLLAPLWQAEAAGRRDPAGTLGARFEGRVELLEDGISSDGPLHVSLRRQAPGNTTDFFDIELDRLQLRLPTDAKASPLRVALAGFRFADPSGGFALAPTADGQSPLLVLQQEPPVRGGCGGRADVQAELRLGAVDHVDVSAVKRFATRVSGLMRAGGPPSPCDPLHLRVTAAALNSWPDLVSAFTEAQPIREAASRAPPLHNLDVTLSIDKARALSYTIATGFRSNQLNPISCTGGESLESKGTLSLARGQKGGELHGTLNCLDLGDAMAIAEAASGHPLRATGISLRSGQLDRLSFDLTLPPGDSARMLDHLSGAIGFEGTVALDIEGSKLEMGARVYGLQEERKRGFHMKGHAEFDAGNVKGTLAVRDPLLDRASAFYGRVDAEKWPNAIEIAAHGALTQKTMGAEVVIRSPEWRPMERGNACIDAARREKLATFPSWAEKMSICIPLAKGAECAKLARSQMAAADYPCTGTTPR